MCLEFKLLIIHGTLCGDDMIYGLIIAAWIMAAVAYLFEKGEDESEGEDE